MTKKEKLIQIIKDKGSCRMISCMGSSSGDCCYFYNPDMHGAFHCSAGVKYGFEDYDYSDSYAEAIKAFIQLYSKEELVGILL